MRIESVRIQNFRSFEDELINFNSYTSLLGANGAGKSTVLAALNIFFQETSSATDVVHLIAEDFHNGKTSAPIEISVTFGSLTEKAKKELGHYVRHNKLSVTAVANFEEASGRAPVAQYGERLVYKKFSPFFERDKEGALVDDLRPVFFEVVKGVPDFPSVPSKPTKKLMLEALRNYEEAHHELCTPERGSDLFYGVEKARGKLQPYIQWIYVPAVKDASRETEEAGNTALGKLLQRTVRQKINFDDDLEKLRDSARQAYEALLTKEQGVLKDLSVSLAKKLATFSHPDTDLSVEWLQGSEKSVTIAEPRATIRVQEGIFKGHIARFGNGFQRSFLLAILQELASLETSSSEEEKADKPTLILACEEPELYQHPPQARHLANVLCDLAESGNQIIATTHSPYFVSGDRFEEIRLIRKAPKGQCVTQATFKGFSQRIAAATGKTPEKPGASHAKLFAALQPEVSEIFFCQKLVLVEGQEDRAYLTSAIVLEGKWENVRRAGVHIVPAGRKSSILQLISIAAEFNIPSYVVFDADGNARKEHIHLHELDNAALLKALGLALDAFPKSIVHAENATIWPINIEHHVADDVGLDQWREIKEEARVALGTGGNLEKNALFVGECLRLAWEKNKKPPTLVNLVNGVLAFAAK